MAHGQESLFTYQSAELPGGIVARSGPTAVYVEAGGIRIMTRSAGVWTEQAFLGTPYEASDSFGASVALDGDTLVVGAPLEDSSATGIGGNPLDNSAADSGAAYVYVRQAGTWSQQAYLKASNTGALDRFGERVALDADTIIVGSVHEASVATGIDGDQSDNSSASSGAAYVFERTAGTWSQTHYVKASNSEAGDGFGSAVAISGDTFVVTAPFEDSPIPGINGFEGGGGGLNAGAAYVYRRTAGTWSKEAYVKVTNPTKKDQFGHAVAIDGDLMAISTIHESSAAIGVDGTQLDESSKESGAVYAFHRDALGWAQTGYLKASNPEAFDHFGSAVAVQGNRILAVADGEHGGTAGVDSKFQTKNGFYTPSRSGSAYQFTWDGLSWAQSHYIKGSHSINAFGSAACTAQDGEFTVGPFVFDEAATVGVRRYGPASGANTLDLYLAGIPKSGETLKVEVATNESYFDADIVFMMASAEPASLNALGGTVLIHPAFSFTGTTPLVLLPIQDQSGLLKIPLTLPPGIEARLRAGRLLFGSFE